MGEVRSRRWREVGGRVKDSERQRTINSQTKPVKGMEQVR